MIPAKYWSPTKKLMVLGAIAGGKAVEDTATGNPLTFITDVSKPLKSLLIPFTPQQDGTGDPSPSNIRSILPWNGLNVFHAGKNLFDISDLIGATGITVSGNEITARMYRLFNLGTVDLVDSIPQGTTFKVAFKAYTDGSYTTSGVGLNIQIVDTNGNSSTVVRINNNVLEETYFNVSITAEAEIVGIKFGYNSGNENIWHIKGLVIGEADVYPASFPSTVYGGTLDVVSGVLTVEWVALIKKWSEGINESVGGSHTRRTFTFSENVKGTESSNYNAKCNVAKFDWSTFQTTHFYLDNNKAYLWLPNETDADTEVQFCAKLYTPQEIQLTPAQITAIVGDNTIWSDADGSMTAVYIKKA